MAVAEAAGAPPAIMQAPTGIKDHARQIHGRTPQSACVVVVVTTVA